MGATLRTNPATAYQILRRFVHLNEGDVVVQNGSNSGVGRALIQVARRMGLVTVSVVRDREDIQDLKEELRGIGGDHVWTEEEMRRSKVGKIICSRWILSGSSGISFYSVITFREL